MRKDLALLGMILLCSIAISFAGATYLLNNKLLYAIVLIALYFSGGLWAATRAIGRKPHAVALGIGIGFFAAVLSNLPLASPD